MRIYVITFHNIHLDRVSTEVRYSIDKYEQLKKHLKQNAVNIEIIDEKHFEVDDLSGRISDMAVDTYTLSDVL